MTRPYYYRNPPMTLGQALVYLQAPPIACACVGPAWIERNGRLRPPPPGTPCCCRAVFLEAEELQRAAHIAANLMLRARARSERFRGKPWRP